MKRNRMKWAMPFAAFCLLVTACSKESNEPVEPQTRTLTIGCGIGKTSATPGTRAGVTPGNPDQSKENFIWHTDDRFKAFLIPEGESNYKPDYWIFTIDSEYSDDKPSKSAAFTCSSFPTGSYKMLATYPADNITYDNNNGFTHRLLSLQTQTGKSSTKHLGSCMSMYATTTVASSTSTMTFHHLNSLVRFTVTNKNATACRIKQILMQNSDRKEFIFGEDYFLTYDWEKKSITNSCIGNGSYMTILTNTSDTEKGIELSAANAADKSDTFDAYMMIGASNVPLTGQQIVFEIVAADADGGNWRSYTSLALDAGKIIAANGGAITWEPGKRYWFDLVLDDALTVSLKEVTNLPGWNDETDL